MDQMQVSELNNFLGNENILGSLPLIFLTNFIGFVQSCKFCISSAACDKYYNWPGSPFHSSHLYVKSQALDIQIESVH